MNTEFDIPNWVAVITGVIIAFILYLYATKQSEKNMFIQIERVVSALSLLFSDVGDLSINQKLELKFKNHKDTFTQTISPVNIDGKSPIDRIIIKPIKNYSEFIYGTEYVLTFEIRNKNYKKGTAELIINRKLDFISKQIKIHKIIPTTISIKFIPIDLGMQELVIYVWEDLEEPVPLCKPLTMKIKVIKK